MSILEVPGVTAADAQARVDARTVIDVVAVTIAGTLAVNKLTQVHADAAALTMLLPTGAPKGTVITVEKSDATTNAVTVSGVIRGVSASLALTLAQESIQFVADSAGSWNPDAGHKTLTSLRGVFVNKLPTVVLVNDFIPAGVNSATTDTAPYWRLAITAAGTGGTIRCNGAYRISSELQLLNFQTVEGDANFWGAGGGGITTNCLDFRTLTANGNGEYVGFRLAASNNFRRLLLVGPLTGAGFSDPRPSYGVASVTLPTPVASAPKFDQVQFYKWTHGTHLYGAYYSVFTSCEWRYNAVGNYFDTCYNMKLINPMFNGRSADDTTSGIGVQIATSVRGLTVLSGSFESYSSAILSSLDNSTIVLTGVYFETPKFVGTGTVAVDLPDGGHGNAVTVTGSSVYILNHAMFVRFTHQFQSSLVACGNKFLYNQFDPAGPDVAAPPTTPLIYTVASPLNNTSVDLYGDNTASCYKGGAQTWGYTDNVFLSGVLANYNVRFPYSVAAVPDPRAAFDMKGRPMVAPLRVVTASSTLLALDAQVIVNAAAATTQKLPAIFGQIPGRTVKVKNIGAGTVTVAPAEASGVTIDAGTSIVTGGSAEFLLYASNWYLV